MQQIFDNIKSLIIVGALMFISFVTYNNYKLQKIQQQASLFYKLQDDFFFKNEKLSTILRLIEENKPILKVNGGEFEEYDLDDYLGFFELLGKYSEDGVISPDWVDNQFGYYIERAYNNHEISEYIVELKKQSKSPNFLYNGFEDLAKEIMQNDSIFLHAKKK